MSEFGTKKLSEIGLMQPVICKHTKAAWSEVVEIMKLGYSSNGRAVYVRAMLGGIGENAIPRHYWSDVADLDEKWGVIDVLNPNV